MQSSTDFPLKYFEIYFANEIFIDLEKFYTSFENENVGHRIKRIDRKKHIVEFYNDCYNERELEYTSFSFENAINNKLDIELSRTKDLIELGFQKRFANTSEVEGFVDFLNVKLEDLKNMKACNQFVFLDNVIDKLKKEVNKYSKESKIVDSKENFMLLTEKEQELSEIKFEVGKEEELYGAIFQFMNGINEKREKIMSNEQYAIMKVYVLNLVMNENLPEISVKLNQVKISNDLLSFTFWVLHEQLYTTKKIRPYFIEFLKCAFSNFDNKEVSSIKKGFGTKKRVVKDIFLPKIILQYL